MVRVVETKSHGLTVYCVYHDKTLVHQFWSEYTAVQACKRLQAKLQAGIK